MKHREIIKTAWQITRSQKGLLWYGIVPAFFSTVVGTGYIFYQVWAFKTSPFFGGLNFDYSSLVDQIVTFSGEHMTLSIVAVILAIISGLGFLLAPSLCEGGVIGIVSAVARGKEIKSGDGFNIGLANFFRMFEYRLIASTFSFAEFFTIFSVIVRHLGLSSVFFIVFAVIFAISLITYFLFLYSEIFIVLEKKSVINSMLSSARLAFGNLQHTFLMWMLMLLIAARVIINIVLLFLIPMLVVFVTDFFVSQIALTIGVILGSAVGLLVLLLSAYLAGTLHVFITASWTLTFLSLDHKRVENLI